MKRWNSPGPRRDPQRSAAHQICLIHAQRTKVKSHLQAPLPPDKLKARTIHLVWDIQHSQVARTSPQKHFRSNFFTKSPLSTHQASVALCDWRHLLHWHPTVTLILCLSVFGTAKLSDATPGWWGLIPPSAPNSNDDSAGSLINDW